ncbi:MAG: hypothetical protein ACJA2S_004532 [Cyclobacteriaceae bacterium]|jgi:hypothetical protein
MSANLRLTLLFFFIVINSARSQSDQLLEFKAIVTGQIVNDSKFSEIKLSSYLDEVTGDTKSLTDKNGYFKFTLHLPSKLEFDFIYKEHFANLLIEPGDSIFISINTKNEPVFEFSGDNSLLNTEINNLKTVVQKLSPPYNDILKKYKNDTPKSFLAYRSKRFKQDRDSIQNIFTQMGASEQVKTFYESKNRVKYAEDLLAFLNMSSMFQHIQFTEENIPYQYIMTVDSLYEKSTDDTFVLYYHNLVIRYSNTLNFENLPALLTALQTKNTLLASSIQMDYYLERFSGYTKDYLITLSLKNLIDNGYIDNEKFTKYSEVIANQFFKSFLVKKLNEYKLLQSIELNSNKIHQFNISELKEVSLFDSIKKKHLGKTLYVDIWGTWCGPCISSFKHLPELRKSLSEKT